MSRASFAWSPVSDSTNSRVPERAMVPMFCTTSSRDMPTPLSETVMVRAALSTDTRIFSSGSDSYSALFASASKRSLSAASEALEISSRRKISLLLYKEWIIRCSSCFTSAWKPSVSLAVMVPNRGQVQGTESGDRVATLSPVLRSADDADIPGHEFVVAEPQQLALASSRPRRCAA